MMGLWKLLKRLKFTKKRMYVLKRMPVALEKPAIERGWKGDWLAMRRG